MELKNKIILEAIVAFNKKGSRFTLDDICKSLLISKKTIYQDFSSKEELIETLMVNSFAEVHKKQEILFKSNLSTDEKLRQLLITGFGKQDIINFEKIPSLIKLYPSIYEKATILYLKGWQSVRILLERGKEEGIYHYWSISYQIRLFQLAMAEIMKGEYQKESSTSYTKAMKSTMEALIYSMKIPINND